ncbi:MAG: hypothetical protein HC884_05215 [Chloroflexaceae bacterium]|nr:hypothetical protein [Chloroflexaceae bacterium]
MAYVGDGSSGLRIIDVSTPAAPAEVGSFDTTGWAAGVQVVAAWPMSRIMMMG